VSIHSTGLGDDEPLVVRPKVACRLLDIGVTRLYELIERGEVESYRDGSARKITTASIRAYIARQLERPEIPVSARHASRRRKAAAATPT
jgi:excisionase family DNA binding protein